MDALRFARYGRGGGDSGLGAWEFSSDLASWDRAPAPAQVGKRLIEGLFQIELPPQWAALMSDIMPWGYGVLRGAQYGIVAGSLKRPRIRYGLPFGATAWAAGYVVLPAARLHKPLSGCDRQTLGKDLSGHLVDGPGTATAFRLRSASTNREGDP